MTPRLRSAICSGFTTVATRFRGVRTFTKAPTPERLPPEAIPHSPRTPATMPVTKTAPTALEIVPLLLIDQLSPIITATAVKESMTMGYSIAPSGRIAGTETLLAPAETFRIAPSFAPMPPKAT